jgi:uncharacterized protein (TIGR00290 family)
MARPKAWLSWSSGKDSAWALEVMRARDQVEVTALLTTINTTHARVAMHAVREALVEEQAERAGLRLVKVPLPWPCPNEAYERAMSEALAEARRQDVTHMVFGDLFLEEIRRYREEKLAGTGITPLFPLWKLDTRELAGQMIRSGLRAYVTCVDLKQLDRSFAGRAFDSAFLNDLPAGVDPCGENGEFHTFAYGGPMFRSPIYCEPGEIVERDGFVFADVVPGESAARATKGSARTSAARPESSVSVVPDSANSRRT